MAGKTYPEEIVSLVNLKAINSELRNIASIYHLTTINFNGESYQCIHMENTDASLQIDRLALIVDPAYTAPVLNNHLINSSELSAWGKYIKKTKLAFTVEEKGTSYSSMDVNEEGEPESLVLYRKDDGYRRLKHHVLYRNKDITREFLNCIQEDYSHGRGYMTELSQDNFEKLLAGVCIHVYIEDNPSSYEDHENSPYMILIDSILGISKTKTKSVSWKILREDDIGYYAIVKTSSDILNMYHLLRFAKF